MEETKDQPLLEDPFTGNGTDNNNRRFLQAANLLRWRREPSLQTPQKDVRSVAKIHYASTIVKMLFCLYAITGIIYYNTLEHWTFTDSVYFTETKHHGHHGKLWGLRILYIIPIYNFKQYIHTELLIDSVRDMCEAGARVSLVLQTATEMPVSMVETLEKRQYCVNSVGSFSLQINFYDPAVKILLVHKHRQVMYDNLDDFDLFIYCEDDMHIRTSHIATFVAENDLLDNTFPDMYSKNYTGQRYMIGHYRWEASSTVWEFDMKKHQNISERRNLNFSTRVQWENGFNEFNLTEIKSGLGPYVSLNNPYSGMWVMTRKQMAGLQEICNFNISGSGYAYRREDVAMYQLVLPLNRSGCGLQRVFPLDQFHLFGVHHLPDQNWERKVGRGQPEKITGNQQVLEYLLDEAKKLDISPRSL